MHIALTQSTLYLYTCVSLHSNLQGVCHYNLIILYLLDYFFFFIFSILIQQWKISGDILIFYI